MDTSKAIYELRKRKGLSQEEFAERLSMTRQAVSRWERGETVPTTDNLKLMASTFGVAVDYLLGRPSAFCQSCGMILSDDNDRGTESDGSPSSDYCAYCYRNGAFTEDVSIDEMIENNLRHLDEWNRENGQSFSPEEARRALMEYLPTLKRWEKD